MDDLQDVYNDLIMEHSMNSYNKKKLETCDLCEMGHNPNCGDEIELQVKLNGDVIEDMAFSGHGCAISQASTSIMIDTLKGKTVEEAKEIDSILDSVGLNEFEDMKADNESLNGFEGEGSKGYRIKTSFSDNVILYLDSNNKVISIRYADTDYYRNGQVLKTFEN